MASLGPGLVYQRGPWKDDGSITPIQKTPWIGGGVAGGGQQHAGNGNWFSSMNPQIFPMEFPNPTSVSMKYESIVHKNYDNIRANKKIFGHVSSNNMLNAISEGSQKMKLGNTDRIMQDNENGIKMAAVQEPQTVQMYTENNITNITNQNADPQILNNALLALQENENNTVDRITSVVHNRELPVVSVQNIYHYSPENNPDLARNNELMERTLNYLNGIQSNSITAQSQNIELRDAIMALTGHQTELTRLVASQSQGASYNNERSIQTLGQFGDTLNNILLQAQNNQIVISNNMARQGSLIIEELDSRMTSLENSRQLLIEAPPPPVGRINAPTTSTDLSQQAMNTAMIEKSDRRSSILPSINTPVVKGTKRGPQGDEEEGAVGTFHGFGNSQPSKKKKKTNAEFIAGLPKPKGKMSNAQFIKNLPPTAKQKASAGLKERFKSTGSKLGEAAGRNLSNRFEKSKA